MKIEKTDESTTYKRIITEHTFEVNGKPVRVETITSPEEEYDYPKVNGDDIANLTDEEHEIFGEDLNEWLDLKVGELKEINE
ncbi:MAG: hypothetical protein V4509_00520 [Patescibacteria group bacterium]